MACWKSWWRSYRYRFVPWLLRNATRRSTEAATGDSHFRQLTRRGGDSDLLTAQLAGFNSQAELHSQLCTQLTSYLRCLASSGCHGNECLSRLFGYRLNLGPSSLPGGAGLGVFLAEGSAEPGSLVGLYPGTIYSPGEPALLASIGNQFILRRADGLLVDANDSWLSRSVFKSCANRDRLTGWSLDGSDWLDGRRKKPAAITPSNALATGHIVNNETGEARPANVRYKELGWPVPCGPDKHELLSRLPCAFYSSDTCARWPLTAGQVPLVALVTCRVINAGEELLSSYVSLATG